MGSLVEFFKKNFHYLLFAVLMIASVLLVGRNMSYSGYKFARACRSVTGPVQKGWAELWHTFRLRSENDELVRQNVALLRKRENMFITKEDTTLTKTVGTAEAPSKSVRLYDYTYAHAIYKTVDRAANCIIIDKGADDGIGKDMAVMSAAGVVGVVSDVSPHFASVIPVLHPLSQISAVVAPAQSLGALIWEGPDPETASLENIPQHKEVNIGDSVFTSGFSNIFPKGELIGTVKEIGSGDNTSFLNIRVRLAADFTKLHTLYIVKNLYKTEMDSLKSDFKNE